MIRFTPLTLLLVTLLTLPAQAGTVRPDDDRESLQDLLARARRERETVLGEMQPKVTEVMREFVRPGSTMTPDELRSYLSAAKPEFDKSARARGCAIESLRPSSQSWLMPNCSLSRRATSSVIGQIAGRSIAYRSGTRGGRAPTCDCRHRPPEPDSSAY